MELTTRGGARARWWQLERLRERWWQLRGPAVRDGGSDQTRYLFRLSRRVRDPRDMLRWYSNDSML